MHELSIAQSILDTIEQHAAVENAGKVLSIRLRIGELTAIIPDALTFSFEVLAKGTRAEGAHIEIESIPWCARCHACQHQFHVEDGMVRCPACSELGGETVSGRELQIMEMDIE